MPITFWTLRVITWPPMATSCFPTLDWIGFSFKVRFVLVDKRINITSDFLYSFQQLLNDKAHRIAFYSITIMR